MIVLVGTIPYKTGLYIGDAQLEGGWLRVANTAFAIDRGTAAMAGACSQVCRFYGLPMPLCIFGGDVGDGKGTDQMYREVNDNLEKYDADVVTLHYMFPKIAYGKPFISKVNSLSKKPQLIADAGGMYLIKTIKQSYLFDVFTPDAAELVFLADEFAPHPLYVRSEMTGIATNTGQLIAAAYRYKNAAHTIIVKGATDYVYFDGVKVAECNEPNIPAMEAIGGTGDTITGMLSALRFREDKEADFKALVVNRLLGQRIGCTPATQIREFVRAIPTVLEDYEKRYH